MSDGPSGATRHHLVIAGTGRSGTSYLVRYLHQLGLQTELAGANGRPFWDESANAGFETNFLIESDAPYVVKSPWFFEFIDEALARTDIQIDAAIITMRDLEAAASSRSILELQKIHSHYAAMTHMSRTWETWGVIPGGILYSLNPLDQARLLAVGFHKVLQRLEEAGVPIVLLAFPRLIQDGDYLFRKLSQFLPGVTREQAENVHKAISDMDKVRVEKELDIGPGNMTVSQYPPQEELDMAALRREVIRLRRLLAKKA